METNYLQFALAGINHKTSSIDIREKYQFNKQELPEALYTFKQFKGVESVIILSTCNRTEYYLTLNEKIDVNDLLKRFYLAMKLIDFTVDLGSFHFLEGSQVTEHLFRVIAGMDSLVLGEYQIQGQVKDAYSAACAAKTVDKSLHKMFHAAFRVGKKIRTQTTINEGKQSISGMASKALIDNLAPDDNVLIIGVNENSKIFAQELQKSSFNNLTFINRTAYKAEMLAHEYAASAMPFDRLEEALASAKGVFTSTAKQGFIVDAVLIKKLLSISKCPSVFIDMAVPRDVDKRALPPEIKYYDIGELNSFLEEQKKRQSEDLPKAEAIVKAEVGIFEEWAKNQNNNLLEPYAEKFELVRQQLLEENQKQFSDDDYIKVDRITRHLVHQLQSTFVRILVKKG